MELKISNMIFSGKIPFKRKISIEESNKLIEQGNLFWSLINQDKSPMLQARVIEEGKQKNPCALIWVSGVMSIAGVKSKKEAEKISEEVMKDIRKNLRSILE